MPKVKKPYRVRRPFSIYKKGQIIYPEGMRRSELLAYGWVELAEDLLTPPTPVPVPAHAPAIEPEPESEPIIEAAVEPEPETAMTPEPPKRRRGRPRKEQAND